MPKLTVAYGIALIILGLVGYFGTRSAEGTFHPTALIPAAFGILALILGLVAHSPGARKHAMHGAAMVSLLAFLMPLGRLIPAATRGTLVLTKPSTMALLTMCILSLIFLIMCVRSFIAARRARSLTTSDQDISTV